MVPEIERSTTSADLRYNTFRYKEYGVGQIFGVVATVERLQYQLLTFRRQGENVARSCRQKSCIVVPRPAQKVFVISCRISVLCAGHLHL